mgnify:CR=1 FL=1
MLPGDKAKLVNEIDNLASQGDLEPLFTIELVLAKSPQKGVKTGVIVIFKRNIVHFDPQAVSHPEVLRAMEKELEEKTEVMYQDPVYFKESDGQWIAWATTEIMRIFRDVLHSNAAIKIKAPQLRIRIGISRRTLLHSGVPPSLDRVVKDIDRLLDQGFKWDPWTAQIRRGRIGAEEAKR